LSVFGLVLTEQLRLKDVDTDVVALVGDYPRYLGLVGIVEGRDGRKLRVDPVVKEYVHSE
jgi:hypothetical protein